MAYLKEDKGAQGERMLSHQHHLVIIGAGVCGLAAGLEALTRGWACTILEKQDQVGGLAAGQKKGENYCDLGVHMFHAFDEEVFDLVKHCMGDERIEVELDARIRWAGSDFRYPLQLGNMLKGMPPLTLAHCAWGLFVVRLKQVFSAAEEFDAEQALIALYGRPLYQFFFEEFTHRYWGHHPKELSAAFVRQKMPRLRVLDALSNFFSSLGLKQTGNTKGEEAALLRETLHYSKTGAQALPQSMAREFEQAGGIIHLGVELKGVHCHEDQVRKLTDTKGRQWDCDRVISTMPLPDLVKLLRPQMTTRIEQASRALQYKPMAVYALLVNQERCMEGLYTYFRDRVFHRVGEPKNAGLEVKPDGATLLIVEMTCEIGDEIWQGAESFLAKLYSDLEEEGLCQREQILERHTLIHEHAYPIFAKGFESELEVAQGVVAKISNLSSTGRQGGFCYPNMHQAMRMGLDTVRKNCPTRV